VSETGQAPDGGDPAQSAQDGLRAVLNATLPRKRLITQGLIRSDQGHVLLCELTYKSEWDLPGGVVDVGEAPTRALARELDEELGLALPNLGLRLVNWLPPWRGWDDACLFVFDLGVHPQSLTSALDLEAREIRAVHWASPDQAAERVAPYLATLLPVLLDDRSAPVYREAGLPMP